MSGTPELAVIGGSGFYEMPGLGDIHEVAVKTPFGPPSDAVRIGTLDGVDVAFLARHGRGHRILPSELPQRANFWALKSIGVRRVLAISAVGSLRDEVGPGHFVAPDQLIDRTRFDRPSTFFGEGLVAHVSLAEPFCLVLRTAVTAAARTAGVTCHPDGALVVIEGPAFGTRAESNLYRSWGATIVGMTALPEAKLAREAELCYALLASSTDYDAWKTDEAPVDAASVFAVLKQNVAAGQAAVRALVPRLASLGPCACGTALDAALLTRPPDIPAAVRERLAPILARRLGGAR